MRLPTLLAAAGLLILAAVSHSQDRPTKAPLTPIPIPQPTPDPAPLPRPTVPKEPTVDELMDTLEKLQNQQVALAEQVQLVKGQLAKKAAAQAERMKKLGVEEIRVPPPHVGQPHPAA